MKIKTVKYFDSRDASWRTRKMFNVGASIELYNGDTLNIERRGNDFNVLTITPNEARSLNGELSQYITLYDDELYEIFKLWLIEEEVDEDNI